MDIGDFSPGGDRSEIAAGVSPSSGVKVKNAWSYITTPSYVFIT
jgi:hypothetical protein